MSDTGPLPCMRDKLLRLMLNVPMQSDDADDDSELDEDGGCSSSRAPFLSSRR